MLLKKKEIIPPFADLIRQIKINNRKKEEMLSIKSRIPRAKRPGSLQPVLPLVPIKLPSIAEEKGKFISFELKTRVGQPDNGTKYKKFVRKFEEGGPQEWIELLKDLDEIWTQNAMNGGQDRAATVRALVGGESETTFNAAFLEARQDAAGVEQPATTNHVQTALEAVTATVFPHRALEIQKLWMNRRMFKPAELTTRQTAAAINRLNNALPMFPSGTNASKFSPVEIIGLLEWSLPPQWRAKFDLDGYVPTLDTKAKLIESCEAIERNEETTKESNKTSEPNNKKTKFEKSKTKAKNSGKKNSAGDDKYFCSEHGHNPSHDTSDCYTLKNRSKKLTVGHEGVKKRSFSNKTFRQEINLLAKKSSKKKVLDLYATAVKREQAKLAKKSAQKRKEPDSDSDTDMSVNAISAAKPRVKSILKKKKKTKNADVPDEETAYQKRFQWLHDHGEPIADRKSDKEKSDDSEEEEEEE